MALFDKVKARRKKKKEAKNVTQDKLVSYDKYISEKDKEATFNKLFDTVVSYTAWGKWYTYMIQASNLVLKKLPKQIAIDSNGRPYVLYKGGAGKFIEAWVTPTHKYVAKDLAEKDYGKAFRDMFGIAGVVDEYKKQKKHYAVIFDISPEEVKSLWKKRVIKEQPEKKPLIEAIEAKLETEERIKKEKTKNYVPSKNLFVAMLQLMFRGNPNKK